MATKRSPRLPTGEEVTLTRRQREIIELMAKGKTNAQIGNALGISLDGAKWHVSEIVSVLGVEAREQAVEAWRERSRLDRRFGRTMRAISPVAGMKLLGAGAAAALVAGTTIGVWLLLANGDGESGTVPGVSPSAAVTTTPTTATATWTPFVVGTATPRVEAGSADQEALRSANLVVYVDQFSDELWASGIHEIVAFDLDAGRAAASFRVSYPISMELVGRSVLINDGTTVTLSDLSGESQRVVYAAPGDRTITGIAVSNGGEFLAIGTEGVDAFPDERSELLVVELATGNVTRTFTFDELGVTPFPLAWRADGLAIEFRQWQHKGAIDMAGTGSAPFSGPVEHHEGSLVEIGDGGRVGAWSTGDAVTGCDVVNVARDRFLLKDLAMGEQFAELEVDGHILKDGLWSPDGREFLVAAHAIDFQLPSGQSCWNWDTPTHYLWNEAGFEPVADHHAVLRSWEGERYVEVDCAGSILPRWTGESLPHVTCSFERERPRASIRVGDKNIDSVRDARVVGFVDAP